MDNNELSLTHLWLDHGYLMAHDKYAGSIILCTEEAFNLGKTDSLKKNWKVSGSGYRYREIKRKKKCFAPVPVNLLMRFSIEHSDLIKKSFKKVYESV
jgi:hypothetical protein